MTPHDRPPVSGEPSTDHGKRILREWLVLRPDHPPNTALILDWIVKAEAEARATPPSLVENIVTYMENEGVVTWGDEGHRARFLDWMKEPTNGD